MSGHNIGTAEIENAITSHPKVMETAVVGYPHSIKGNGIYAYICINPNEKPSKELKEEIIKLVREKIGVIAKLDIIQFVENLPKTRSGKIMRRILRKIAANEFEDLGDISTLVNPNSITDIIENKKN